MLRKKASSTVFWVFGIAWPGIVPTVVGSIETIDVLTCCALFHSVCDLKVAQMNVQCSLIWELVLYKFRLGHNTTETANIICCTKGEGTVDRESNPGRLGESQDSWLSPRRPGFDSRCGNGIIFPDLPLPFIPTLIGLRAFDLVSSRVWWEAATNTTVDQSRVTRWFKKCCLDCKSLNDQARSGRTTTMDSKVVLQAIGANLLSST